MIYNNLGIAFMEIFEFEKAKENFDKALKIKIDFPEVYNNQGIIFRKLKDFDQSLKYLKKRLNLNHITQKLITIQETLLRILVKKKKPL